MEKLKRQWLIANSSCLLILHILKLVLIVLPVDRMKRDICRMSGACNKHIGYCQKFEYLDC